MIRKKEKKGGGRIRYMESNGYKPTLVYPLRNNSRIQLNLRYEQLVYVMEETHVYGILDIDQLYMNSKYI